MQAHDELVEILLSQGKVLAALQLVPRSDVAPARKYLECALDTGDQAVFYTVYKFFERRNLRLRGSRAFIVSDQCERAVAAFESMNAAATSDTPADIST